MARRKSKTAEWMEKFPTDKPCPEGPGAARAWRRARFESPRAREVLQKYEAAMALKRAAEAKASDA
jgi:hypothetical protein